MPLLAVTALERLHKIPPQFWLKAAMAVAVVVAAVFVLRKLARLNKVVLGVGVFVVLVIIGFSWIYNRNEPRFLTPLMNKIAPFFPSKNTFAKKQATPADNP
ncbi:hypothetical protein K0B96_00315 [Horticoccus luteus]|uniref:Uncharacterized protein n=1 Tax=Horticoccus luteus TaxID=2862869 RepID=A0A8F9TW00_9BACT|nr:hypothetical protein [Horticoccus luteus]QYM79092.1 hypothetical protein K0B96_00315 [Horticoccus luteus]